MEGERKKAFQILSVMFCHVYMHSFPCLKPTPKSLVFQMFTHFHAKFPAVKINRQNFNELTVS